jgi:hypothetical protein
MKNFLAVLLAGTMLASGCIFEPLPTPEPVTLHSGEFAGFISTSTVDTVKNLAINLPTLSRKADFRFVVFMDCFFNQQPSCLAKFGKQIRFTVDGSGWTVVDLSAIAPGFESTDFVGVTLDDEGSVEVGTVADSSGNYLKFILGGQHDHTRNLQVRVNEIPSGSRVVKARLE